MLRRAQTNQQKLLNLEKHFAHALSCVYTSSINELSQKKKPKAKQE
jgi:hydrogenase maturation factor HypF (carbamoyltransferase family)